MTRHARDSFVYPVDEPDTGTVRHATEEQTAVWRDTVVLQRVPLVTGGLLVLNLAVFVYQWLLPPTQQDLFVLRWAAIPSEITEQDLDPKTPLSTALTLLTSLFLHADWLHLGNNLFYLWVFGEGVERILGRAKYLLAYLVCGVGAALLHTALNPRSLIPLVGASGAIAGLMAASLILVPKKMPRVFLFGFWLALQVMSSRGAFAPTQQWTEGVAWWAHMGGLAIGALLAFGVRYHAQRRRSIDHFFR